MFCARSGKGTLIVDLSGWLRGAVRATLGEGVDDDEEDKDDSDVEVPMSRVTSASSSRASSRLSTYALTDASEAEDDLGEGVPMRKERPPLAKKSSSKRGSSNIFLTAAEQRQQQQKEDKKSNEDPFDFLQDVRDKDGVRPGEPGYDPRTLYIPQKAWKTFTPFEKQVKHLVYLSSL